MFSNHATDRRFWRSLLIRSGLGLLLLAAACGPGKPTPPPTATSVPLVLLPTPTPTPPYTPTPVLPAQYAVILLAEGEALEVHREPDYDSPVIDLLAPGTAGLRLSGQERSVEDQTWREIYPPSGGSGWVNGWYLIEQMPPADFCADGRVNELIDRLGQALTSQDSELFASLVSPLHGLDVTYLRTGRTVNYGQEQAAWVLQSTYVNSWGTHPASGLEVTGAFRDLVLPPLLEVFSGGSGRSCNNPLMGGSSYTFQWPVQYNQVNYYALHKPGSQGQELDWRTWLVGVEYVDGQPYLFALLHLFWEP